MVIGLMVNIALKLFLPGDDVRSIDTKFFDVLLVLVKNLKVLLLVPLMVGIMVWVSLSFTPKKYTSQALIDLNAQEMLRAATLMQSQGLINDVKTDLQLSVDVQALSKNIKAIIGRDGLLKLEVTDTIPSRAQSIATLILQIWLKKTTINENQKKELEVTRKELLQAIADTNLLISNNDSYRNPKQVLQKKTGTQDHSDFLDVQTKLLSDVVNISFKLNNEVTSASIVQDPTLPSFPSNPDNKIIIAIAVLIAELIVLLAVFIASYWKKAAGIPLLAQRQQQIIASLKFWGK